MAIVRLGNQTFVAGNEEFSSNSRIEFGPGSEFKLHFIATSSGNVNQLGINYQDTSAANFAKLALYRLSDKALLGETDAFVPVDGENIIDMLSPATVTESERYAIAHISEDFTKIETDGSGAQSYAIDTSFTVSTAFPDPWTAAVGDNAPGIPVLFAQEASTAPDFTQRKGSTWDVTHGLGTITSATLNGIAITINSTGTGTVNLTDTSGIATSGEYDLVLGDGTSTETFTVQLNVIGLPAYTLNKNGSALGNLTGIKFRVTATGELDGTEILSANNLTATAGVLDEPLFLPTGDVDDVVTVSILTGANDGGAVQTTIELL